MERKPTDLYRWEKLTKPKENRVYSRSQRLTSNTDVQDWIKTVEDAANTAAAQTFGTQYASPKSHGRYLAKKKIENTQIHEAAYVEAQELLQDWMETKMNLDPDDADPELADENWTQKTQSDIQREWDHLLHHDDLDAVIDLGAEVKDRSSPRKPYSERDPYEILQADENMMVDSVLQSMMQKAVIKDDFTRDLGMEDSQKNIPDPRTKMALRQKQVKEARLQRLAERQSRLKQQQQKKDANFTARKIIQKEEAKSRAAERQEEQLIQHEMAQIRREMEEERAQQQEQRLREQRERELLAQQAHAQMEREDMAEYQARSSSHAHAHAEQRQAEHRQARINQRLAEVTARRATDNMRLLQRCMSAWWGAVVDRRLALGRATATADWRLLQHTFNAWKHIARCNLADKHAQIHQAQVKDHRRKELQAAAHYRQKLLTQCLVAWQLYVTQRQNEKLLKQDQLKTRNKMSAFLEAAASGRINSARQGHKDSHDLCGSLSLGDIGSSGGNTEQQLNELFQGGEGRGQGTSTDRTGSTTPGSRSHRPHTASARPTEAFQLTRKHASLTKEELENFNRQQKQGATSPTDPSHHDNTSSRSGSKKARDKNTFVVNAFENRHAAQQRALVDQQKQLAEQQRLIEELQYLQKQQLLQQQLATQIQLQQHLQGGDGASQGQQDVTALQKHIESLQRSLVAAGGDLTLSAVESPDTEAQDSIPKKTTTRPGTKPAQQKGDVKSKTANRSGSGHQSKSGSGQPGVSGSEVNGEVTDRSAVTSVSGKSAASTGSQVSRGGQRHDEFLSAMEQRQAERRRQKEEREEKRRRAEADRLNELQAEEAARKELVDIEKRKRVEEHRERKRHEKQREQDKQQEAERMKELYCRAEEHHRLAVLRYRGWWPWRCLVDNKHTNIKAADTHYRHVLCRGVLQAWHSATQHHLNQQRHLADNMHQFTLLKRCFNNWKQVGKYMSVQEQRAERHHRRRVLNNALMAWADWAGDEKMASWKKERQAKEHNQRRVVLRCWRAWRRFPSMRAEEEEKERRRADMRRKVAALIPDFHGVSMTTSQDGL